MDTNVIIRKKKGEGFIYISNKGNIIKDERILNRIKSFRIPPAWTNVIISRKDSDIQAMGTDSKDRHQYIYSKEWTSNQEREKFIRLIYFLKNINYIRRYLKSILKEEGWFREKLIAFIISIIDICGLRIGNEKYKELYDSHGISTLKRKHITIQKNKIKLEFVGKKNVVNTCEIKHKNIVRLFKELDEYNKPNVEDYFLTINNKIISNASINNYLKSFGDFTIKDFRTYRANIEFIKCLYNSDIEQTKYKTKLVLNKCLDVIADKLNNTRIVLKNKYICKILIDKYLEESSVFIKKIKYYKNNKLLDVDEYESTLLYYLHKYKNI